MSKQDHVKVQDELDILTNEIEQSFMQQNGWSRCRYLLGKLVNEKDKEIKRLQAEFTGELTQPPLEMIRAKCEQYWNEFTTPCPEEWHVILEFIHKLARFAENDIEKLKQKHSNVLDFIDGVRNIARNRNPDGVTLLDFMSVWNEQFEDKIKKQQTEIERLQAIVDCCVAECPVDEKLEVNERVALLAEKLRQLKFVVGMAVHKLETYGGHSASDAPGAYRILMDEVVKEKE